METSKPKLVFDTSKSFKFEVNKTEKIQFTGLPVIDENYVYGKVQRLANGLPMRGPKGELYHTDTGEVLYSKFNNKDGSKKLLKPEKRYVYHGWHVSNQFEQENPLKFVASLDQHKAIFPSMKKTQVFEITKGSDNKYFIQPIWDDDPYQEQEEPTEEEQEQAIAEQAAIEYEASRKL